MQHFILDFSPPMENLDGEFNTFRIGGKWAKTLSAGDTVILADKKQSRAIGCAQVLSVHSGKLSELASSFAHDNHNQRHQASAQAAADALMENMRRRYGPHIAKDNKLTSVIYLRRLNE